MVASVEVIFAIALAGASVSYICARAAKMARTQLKPPADLSVFKPHKLSPAGSPPVANTSESHPSNLPQAEISWTKIQMTIVTEETAEAVGRVVSH
ncbi:hypothetical protein RvY_17277 [Ramazzottius varieornatus]|uniref:Uncharacterized protein n=1 Tax=Ramazzottius varieornatus TaxID=947166 RepID=A0A1D1W7K7_RAMVA|nr:hypothetical protein RvY_17277 [Ramazzottius varieornatus]